MTKYTPVHKFPYPEPGSTGAGALDIQRLAERSATRLDYLDSAWVDMLTRTTGRVSMAVNSTGYGANVDGFVLFDTQDIQLGGILTSTSSIEVTDAEAGWYLLQAQIRSQPAGGTTQPTRKTMIRVYRFTEFDSVLERQFHREDFDAGLSTVTCVAGVAYLDGTRNASVYFRHNNPTSTITILAGSTFSAHKIIPG